MQTMKFITASLVSMIALESTAYAVCGNGVLDSGEACEDGNTTNGDGCDDTCATKVDGIVPKQSSCFHNNYSR